VFCGDPSPEAAEALDVYLAAQAAGIAAAAPGRPILGIDLAMAEVLGARGFGDAFLRPTFHGVGTEHEEAPIPGGHAVVHGEEQIESIEVGMVLAIGNCGIYRDGFGVRAEDTVAVTFGGPEELTSFPKRPQTTSLG
jgi:Xaa-Pro aminopeptidase